MLSTVSLVGRSGPAWMPSDGRAYGGDSAITTARGRLALHHFR